jgi:hypothetical protein
LGGPPVSVLPPPPVSSQISKNTSNSIP